MRLRSRRPRNSENGGAPVTKRPGEGEALESGHDCVHSPCLLQVEDVSQLLETPLAFSCSLVSLAGPIGCHVHVVFSTRIPTMKVPWPSVRLHGDSAAPPSISPVLLKN